MDDWNEGCKYNRTTQANIMRIVILLLYYAIRYRISQFHFEHVLCYNRRSPMYRYIYTKYSMEMKLNGESNSQLRTKCRVSYNTIEARSTNRTLFVLSLN